MCKNDEKRNYYFTDGQTSIKNVCIWKLVWNYIYFLRESHAQATERNYFHNCFAPFKSVPLRKNEHFLISQAIYCKKCIFNQFPFYLLSTKKQKLFSLAINWMQNDAKVQIGPLLDFNNDATSTQLSNLTIRIS